jgi:hypothetical protein
MTRKQKCDSLDQTLNRKCKDLLSARLIDSQGRSGWCACCMEDKGTSSHVVSLEIA